jgi:hypothetical protein
MNVRLAGSWLRLFGVLVAAPLSGAGEPAQKPAGIQGLEGRPFTVAEIVIHLQPVFDLSKPAENNWLGRTANFLHLSTREKVIRRALLFEKGGRVRARNIYESERVLRALAFVKDASIHLEPLGDGQVRAHVWVRDAWTLAVDAGFEQVGGQRTMHFGIQDQNFLGFGKTVGFSVAKNHERTERQYSYRDPQFFGSRWQFNGDYQGFTDGYGRGMALDRPFFALATPWSCAFRAETRKSSLAVYDQGQALFQTPHWVNALRLSTAWSVKQEEDRAWRAGIAFTVDDHRYGPLPIPEPPLAGLPSGLPNRRQRGPGLILSHRQDAYQSFRNIKGMDTPEDYNLTWEGSLEGGSFTRRFGSTRPGPYLVLKGANGWSKAPDAVTLFEGTLRARSGQAAGEDLRVDARLATYAQWAPSRQLAVYAGAGYVHHPDPENLQYMGGTEGLRAYPNLLHPGDTHWILSAEQRFFTEHRWWGLFRLGFMVFADAGAVRRMDGSGWSPLYPDVGIGLRLGDLKSSLARVLVLSVAVPIERQRGQSGWQLGIGNSFKF